MIERQLQIVGAGSSHRNIGGARGSKRSSGCSAFALPQKRAFISLLSMSALCQMRT
jgi:hypothetical protein